MMCFLRKLFGSSCDDKGDNKETVNVEENLTDQVSPDSEFKANDEKPEVEANEDLKKEMSEDNF